MMDETIAYEPDATNRPADQPERAPQGGGRYAYTSGTRPLDGYTIKRAIGRGGFGEVYYAISDAGKEVALKLITRNLEVERRGVMHCMNLKSPHLITIHDLRSNDDGDTFVIMEYVAGPSLEAILRRYPDGMPHEEVRHWLKGLVDGVSYLHDHGVVHRDLKPANLFLEEGVVKIGDYGLSKAITNSREPGHSQSVGTCHYMAPEIGTGKYHKGIDVYAIGIILYEMITGRVPFDGESVHEVLMKHLTSRPDLSPLPEPFRKIVARALAKDPNQRPQRVTDLLLPGDAPREPAVRFIADAKASAAGSAIVIDDEPKAKPEPKPADDVLHIGAEEPVFYIGPDTRPPRDRRTGFARMVRAVTPRPLRRPAQPQPPRRPAPAPAPAARPVAQVTPAPARPAKKVKPTAATPPPVEPPPAPTRRERAAELTGSMLLAAPMAAVGTLLSVPIFGFLGANHPQTPDELALVFAAVLLGSWGVLAQGKACEGSNACKKSRRSGQLLLGVGLGAIIAGLTGWAHLGFPPGALQTESAEWLRATVGPKLGPQGVLALSLMGFFGLAFGLNGFWKLTDRDRKARFRFWPALWAMALAAIAGEVIGSPQPWGPITVGLIAVVTQISSPWSREAAAYARYQQAVGRRKAA